MGAKEFTGITTIVLLSNIAAAQTKNDSISALETELTTVASDERLIKENTYAYFTSKYKELITQSKAVGPVLNGKAREEMMLYMKAAKNLAERADSSGQDAYRYEYMIEHIQSFLDKESTPDQLSEGLYVSKDSHGEDIYMAVRKYFFQEKFSVEQRTAMRDTLIRTLLREAYTVTGKKFDVVTGELLVPTYSKFINNNSGIGTALYRSIGGKRDAKYDEQLKAYLRQKGREYNVNRPPKINPLFIPEKKDNRK